MPAWRHGNGCRVPDARRHDVQGVRRGLLPVGRRLCGAAVLRRRAEDLGVQHDEGGRVRTVRRRRVPDEHGASRDDVCRAANVWSRPVHVGRYVDSKAHLQRMSGAHVPVAVGSPHHELHGTADLRCGAKDVARQRHSTAYVQ